MRLLRTISAAAVLSIAGASGAFATTIGQQFPFLENKLLPDIVATVDTLPVFNGSGDTFAYDGLGQLTWQDTNGLAIDEDNGSGGSINTGIIGGELRATAFINTDGTLGSGDLGAGETGAGKLTITGQYTSPNSGVVTDDPTDILLEADLVGVGFLSSTAAPGDPLPTAPIEMLWKLRPLPSEAFSLFEPFVISRHSFPGQASFPDPFSSSFSFSGGTPAGSMNVDIQRVNAVPLPAALPLLLAGIGGMALVGRKRKAA